MNIIILWSRLGHAGFNFTFQHKFLLWKCIDCKLLQFSIKYSSCHQREIYPGHSHFCIDCDWHDNFFPFEGQLPTFSLYNSKIKHFLGFRLWSDSQKHSLLPHPQIASAGTMTLFCTVSFSSTSHSFHATSIA